RGVGAFSDTEEDISPNKRNYNLTSRVGVHATKSEGEKTQEFLSVVASSHNPRAILNFRVLLKETFVVSLLRNS
ncbi:hypothetical protein GLYMA_02G160600v4, partial [Glycine max]